MMSLYRWILQFSKERLDTTRLLRHRMAMAAQRHKRDFLAAGPKVYLIATG
jgi:hypothetical protein